MCNRDLYLEHLEEAKRRRARVFCYGDSFDSMQGRFDPRRSMDELRPEFRTERYYDVVVKKYAEYLAPFADIIDLISIGNHEDAVLKNANTDLTDRLCYALNVESGGNISRGGYGGWVRFMLNTMEGVPQRSVKLKYFHGSGGEAPVTRGAIQTNRQAVYLPDADIVVNGHSHNNYYIPISRERLSNKGIQYFDLQHHVRTPGYKQAYGDGATGWEVTRGGVPKPIGAVWCKMSIRPGPHDTRLNVNMEFTADIRGADAISLTPDGYTGAVFNDDPEDF
jgi:hypothetical protein